MCRHLHLIIPFVFVTEGPNWVRIAFLCVLSPMLAIVICVIEPLDVCAGGFSCACQLKCLLFYLSFIFLVCFNTLYGGGSYSV